MHRIKSWAICLISLLLTPLAFADDFIVPWSFKPFIGIDGGVKHQNFEPSFGKIHFRHNYPIANFYIGSIFYKYLGFEAGYEYAFRENRNAFYFPNQPALGFLPQSNIARMYFSNAYFNGWHIDLLGFWPIYSDKTELTGTIGIAWLKGHYQTTLVAASESCPPNTVASFAWWESDTRTLLRVGIGLKQMITQYFGARVELLWENTEKLGAQVVVPPLQTLGAQEGTYTVRPENSYIAMVGIFLQLT